MAGERTVPILPVPNLDEAIDFYESLGFVRSYRQLRPNPYAVVEHEDIVLHLAGIAGYDPAASVCSVIVTVPDAEAMHQRFSEGFRATYGRLHGNGVTRLLRIRRKAGTATGFSVVDVGGNWLRFYRAGETEDSGPRAVGLARVLEAAARQGDARGDEEQALAVLDAGLTRHPDAPAEVLAEVMEYRRELRERLGHPEL